MQLLVPILSEVFRTVINSIRHFRTEMGTRVEMYPVIQIQFLDGLRNRLQGTCRSAIGQFFFHLFSNSSRSLCETSSHGPVPFSFFKGTYVLISHVRVPSEWDWLMEMLDLLYFLFDD